MPRMSRAHGQTNNACIPRPIARYPAGPNTEMQASGQDIGGAEDLMPEVLPNLAPEMAPEAEAPAA
eukprot:gene2718-2757_t